MKAVLEVHPRFRQHSIIPEDFSTGLLFSHSLICSDDLPGVHKHSEPLPTIVLRNGANVLCFLLACCSRERMCRYANQESATSRGHTYQSADGIGLTGNYLSSHTLCSLTDDLIRPSRATSLRSKVTRTYLMRVLVLPVFRAYKAGFLSSPGSYVADNA